MTTRFGRRAALGVIAGTAASFAVGPAMAQSNARIAFVHRRGPTDFGWSYEHQRGAEEARAIHGNRAQIDDVFHDPAEGTDIRTVMQGLVADGYTMIFTTSPDDIGATTEMAFTAPQVRFESCGGYLQLPNMATYDARAYEGRVIQGYLAATMSSTNRIGYLATKPSPDVIRGINAAYQAAKAVKPNVVFDVIWLSTAFDPRLEYDVASDLVDRGCDVLMQQTMGTKAIELAQERGIFAFGQWSDMAAYGPDAVLTSLMNNWGPYYTGRIGAFLDGTWQSGAFWGGLADKTIVMSDLLESIPNSAHTGTKELLTQLSSGQRHAFEGPINKQDGSSWLAAGQSASDADLATMNFYLDGNTSVYPSNI